MKRLKGLLKDSIIVVILLYGHVGTMSGAGDNSNTGVIARITEYSEIIKSADVNFGGIMIPLTGETVVHLNHANVVSLVSGSSLLYNVYDWRTGVLNVMSDQYTSYHIEYVGSMYLIGSKSGELLYNPMIYTADGTYIPSGTNGSVPDGGSSTAPGSGGFNPIGGVDNNLFSGKGQFLVGGNLTIPYTAIPDIYYSTLDVNFIFQ